MRIWPFVTRRKYDRDVAALDRKLFNAIREVDESRSALIRITRTNDLQVAQVVGAIHAAAERIVNAVKAP